MADENGLYKKLHNMQFDDDNKPENMKIIDFVKQKIKNAKLKKNRKSMD